jgi:hypothetical protein
VDDGGVFEPFTHYLESPPITVLGLNPSPLEVTYSSGDRAFANRSVTWNGGQAQVLGQFGCGVPDLDLSFALPPVEYVPFVHEIEGDVLFPARVDWSSDVGEVLFLISGEAGKSISCTAPAADGSIEVDTSFLDQLGERGSASLQMSHVLQGSANGWDYAVNAWVSSSASGTFMY